MKTCSDGGHKLYLGRNAHGQNYEHEMIILMATDMDPLGYIWMLGSTRDQTAYAAVARYITRSESLYYLCMP